MLFFLLDLEHILNLSFHEFVFQIKILIFLFQHHLIFDKVEL